MSYEDANNRHHRLFLCFASFLLLSLSAADDASVMSKLFTSLSAAPSNWKAGNDFCSWDGIQCDKSKRVVAINLASKSLTGTLPSDLNQLSQLKTLSLQRNSLSGPLPTLANLTLLREVSLDSNNFTSIPTDFFLGLSNLQSFIISDNGDLSPWILPNDLTECINLQTFQASNAGIMGSIPDIFDSFPSLQSLRLSFNNLTGNLPKSFGGSGIQNLWLNSQFTGLSGTLYVLSSMTELGQVWLQANAFTGVIPDLSKCTNLYDLQLRDNQLTGTVPPSLTSLPNLANITLLNNALQGTLPEFAIGVANLGIELNSFCLPTPGPCDPQVTALLEIAKAIGYPMSLAESWKGNDACRSWTFIACDSSGKNVTLVNFARQNFSGSISPAFANLTSLRSLILNDNNLVGSIPRDLTSIPGLQLFDVSNNKLSCSIPEFPKTVKFSHEGNRVLGQTIPIAPSDPPGSTKGSSVSTGMIVGIVLSVLIFIGILLLFVFVKCCAKRRHQKSVHVENPEMHVCEGGNVVISFQVLQQVTNNFSEENILGKGGFGVVYKGELHDGTKIAVKRMKSGVTGTKGLNEFQAEIVFLAKVRHRHLVSLLGYCINENERLLVYVYMPQGTLSQHLFEWSEHKTPPLNWNQRVSIALDVARGVEYLHNLAQSSFIHRDLKPSNILLGDDMRAKVADFGLVKNVPDGKYSVSTRVAGTFGYLAPEYAATGRVTTKVDVFAFGVVLMELITGRKALDETMPDEECHLVTWFRRVLISKENMLKAIDQTLDTKNEETLDSISKLGELAVHCTSHKPFQRPDMGHVVNVLGPLVEQWKPSRLEEEDGYGCDLHMSLPRSLQSWQAGEGTSRTFDISVMYINNTF